MRDFIQRIFNVQYLFTQFLIYLKVQFKLKRSEKGETLMELFNLIFSIIKECQSGWKHFFFRFHCSRFNYKMLHSEREEKQQRRKFSLVLWISLLILQASTVTMSDDKVSKRSWVMRKLREWWKIMKMTLFVFATIFCNYYRCF